MFDAHSPFQAAGNFGGANGIAEMLLQDRVKDNVVEIELLPALPQVLADGSFKGLRTGYGFEIDAKWKNDKLVSATARSLQGNPFRLKYKSTVLKRKLKRAKSLFLNQAGVFTKIVL